MDDHTLKVLEFDKILEKAASYAVSAPGREAVLATRPLAALDAIRRAEELVSEVKDLIVSTGRFPLDGLADVRDFLRRARPSGALLDGKALRALGAFLAAGRTLREFLDRQDRPFPRCADLAAEIRIHPELERRIALCLTEEGEVADAASEDLRAIRKAIRELDERIRDRLEGYLRAPEMESVLQEKFVTLRDGRHVLPVKAELKPEVPGIIHGRSDTGNTVFIEPVALVDMGNERKDLDGREAAEVRRILRLLTDEARALLPDLEHNVSVLARADAAAAKARLSQRYSMGPAAIHAEASVRLRQARHPLLVFQGEQAVPLDLTLDPARSVLLVSGPNTGGKTVALKTVGLLCLLAQAGMHVPAGERSVFPVFRRILADIGDEQSIEANLSTFSSHLARIVEVLRAVEPGTLVLLDEIGAATDPVEGGALAAAVLQRVHRAGAACVATTHLTTLKVFAHTHPGMENAGMEFDEASGRPTYRLVPGTPGSSRALATARGLGVPDDVLAEAESLLGEDRAAMENLLEDLRRETARAREESARLEAERLEAASARRDLETRLAATKKERQRILQQAHEEAAALLKTYRDEADKAVERIREIQREKPAPGGRDRARVEQRRIGELSRRALSEAQRLEPPPDDATDEPLREGQTVALRTMRGFGRIQKLDGKKGRADVLVDGLPFNVSVADLIPVQAAEPRPGPRRRARSVEEVRPPVEKELNLLGVRVEPALESVRRYLDEAVLSDVDEVRIIHGFGTGALQKAVEELLRTHPSVGSFRPGGKGEGGAGATVVKLK